MFPRIHALALTLAWASAVMLPHAVSAATLAFSPNAQQVDLGSIAAVDIRVTGLNNQFVGAYDFFVDFDPALLAVLSTDFGPSLGNPFDSLFDVVTTSGRINVSEVALLPDLTGLQAGSGDLLLFTLRFQTLGTGTSALNFAANILGAAGGYLGDVAGVALAITAPAAGSVTIVTAAPPPPPPPASVPVPEPSTLALLMAALVAAACRRRGANA